MWDRRFKKFPFWVSGPGKDGCGATRDGLLKQLTFCLFIYINYSETEILCQHFS